MSSTKVHLMKYLHVHMCNVKQEVHVHRQKGTERKYMYMYIYYSYTMYMNTVDNTNARFHTITGSIKVVWLRV